MKLLIQGLACLHRSSVSANYYLGIITVKKGSKLFKLGFWFHQEVALDLNLGNLKLLSEMSLLPFRSISFCTIEMV